MLRRRPRDCCLTHSTGCGQAESQLQLLTRINSDEFLQALGLGWLGRARAPARWLCRLAASRISRDMLLFDRILAEQGLYAGSRRLLASLIGELQVSRDDALPERGPLLVVANHPGLTDALALFATINRPDLRIVAADYPLLHALRGVNARFIWVDRQQRHRLEALNRIVTYLRGGGAVLLFPAGKIEPDPAIGAGAELALASWSLSIGLIARRVVDLTVVPAIVSGVLAPGCQHHPLTRIRRRQADRQQLGAMLQVLAGTASSTTVRVAYGRCLSSHQLRGEGRWGAGDITALIVEQARRLMRESASQRGTAGPVDMWRGGPHLVQGTLDGR